MNLGLQIIVTLLLVIPAFGMNLDISSSGVDNNGISVSYFPGTGGIVDHRVLIDGINGLSNHLRATGGVTYSVSSNGAKSAFKVVGSSAVTLYHLKAVNSVSQIWLNVNNADSITAQSYATYLTAYAKSNAAVTSTSHDAAMDYYGRADTTGRASGTLSSYQLIKPGASTSNSPPATPVGAGSPTANSEGAKGSRIVINEEARNSNNQYAYSELFATDASVPFYEGRAGTANTAANAISYPDGGFSSYPITTAGTLSMYLYSYDPSTKKYAMATAYGTGVTGFSLSYMNASSVSSATTANITGISAAGSLVRAVSEYYVGTISGTNKYRMTAEGSGSGTLSGSVSTVSGSKASLSGMSLSGTSYATLQDRRSAGTTVKQSITVTSSGKSFAGMSAASGKSLGAIQNCVNAAGSGDTLSLAAGTYTENVAINKNLNIIGAGRGSTTVNGNSTGPVFNIGASDIYVTLKGMNITNGKYTYGGGIYNRGISNIDDCIIYSNTATSNGGGIYSTGTTTLTSCNISVNTASSGGGIHSIGNANLTSCSITKNTASSNGGGIFQSSGTTKLTSCNISANNALNGGGIFQSSGTTKLTSSNISANKATGTGGGIFVNSGTATLTSSSITKNTASSTTYGGGGIIIGGGTTTLTSCNISANTAVKNGGGIYQSSGTSNVAVTSSNISANNASGNGGGIYFSSGTITLTSSNISENNAASGGGIYQSSGTAMINGTTAINSNIAMTSRGGGIYSSGSPTLSGTGISIAYNKAKYGSATPWYEGYGIYSSIEPTTSDNFNYATQVHDNTPY